VSSDLSQFYSRTREARKVIVVDLGFLGDTIHLIPALWELKRNYARAELHLLTSSVGRDVLRLAPCVDRVWSLEMYRETRTLGEQVRVLRAIRRERPDVAFNFSGADRTNLITALTGAPHRVAHRGARWHFYNPWLIRDWIPRQDQDLIVFEQRRQILAACGLHLEPARFDLRVDDTSARWAAELVPTPAIHISPNSSKATKEWPLQHYVALIQRMRAELPEVPLVVSGSARAREQERLRNLGSLLGSAKFTLLPGNVTIPQLAAVLKRCRLHIGSDSGVLHLAFALNVPSISFLREQRHFNAFKPTGPRHHVFGMPCPCIDGQSAPCEAQDRAECLARIDPKEVCEIAAYQLKTWPAPFGGSTV
jgi:ADP-heptose:LPS heptosyltransferase